MNEALTALLAKNNQLNNPTETTSTDPIEDATRNGIHTATPAVEETKFQRYTSARPSGKLITKAGKRIGFTNFEFFTKDQDIIDYLDEEIAGGLQGFVKGKLMTKSERDPMEVLRKKHFEEFKATQIQEAADKAAGITKDMGTTKQAGDAAINPTSTDAVAN